MGTSSSGPQQSSWGQLGGLGNFLQQPSQAQSFQMPAPASYQPPISQGGGSTGPAASGGQGSPGNYGSGGGQGPTPTNPLWTSQHIPSGLSGPATGMTSGGMPASLQQLLGKAQPAAAAPSKF